MTMVAALALATAPARAGDRGAACGSKENPCPLQKWMRANVGVPLAANDLAAVATGLEKSAALAPDASWKSWPEIARAGAKAARAGDVAGTKASCKQCHDQWKDKWKKEFRQREVN